MALTDVTHEKAARAAARRDRLIFRSKADFADALVARAERDIIMERRPLDFAACPPATGPASWQSERNTAGPVSDLNE